MAKFFRLVKLSGTADLAEGISEKKNDKNELPLFSPLISLLRITTPKTWMIVGPPYFEHLPDVATHASL
jgi:hypothetical protein